jgi:hypothetical protein
MQIQKSKMFGMEKPLFGSEDTFWSSYADRIGQQIKRCSSKQKPDFLVIAPPRTGTTWLAENLRRHPQIFIPPEKEVRFFDIHWRRCDINWYLDRFSGNSAQFSGEATPSYALLPNYAIELIRLLNPQLKLIFIMRDPTARAWSHMKHNFINREANFALSPVGDRFEDLDIRSQFENFIHDYPLSAGDYAGALARWSRCFPRSQFHIMFFDEIQTDPESCLRKVFRFIGVNERMELSAFPTREQINRGLDGEPSALAGEFLRYLFTPRVRLLEKFLQLFFGLTLPWKAHKDDLSREPIWLMDKPKGWRIYLLDGNFWAIEKTNLIGKPDSSSLLKQLNEAKPKNVKQAEFLGDLLIELENVKAEARNVDTEQVLSPEDRRLTHVLKNLARSYDDSLQSSVVGNYYSFNTTHANRAEPQLLEEGYRGFNFIGYNHRVWAVDQTAGPTDLRDTSATQRLAAEGRLLTAESLDDARLAVDGRVLEERTIALSSLLNDRLKALDRDLEHKLSTALSAQESVWRDEIIRLDKSLWTVADQIKTLSDDGNRKSLGTVEGNGAEPRLLEESYQHFNLVVYDHKIWAVDQAVGPTDLRDASARNRLVIEGRLFAAMTLDGARLGVDIRVLEERVHSMETRLDEVSALMLELKLSKQVLENSARELDGLRNGLVEIAAAMQKLHRESQEIFSQAGLELEKRIDDLKQNALVRLGSYITRNKQSRHVPSS